MEQSTVRGQITITDLNDGRAVNLYIEANHPATQVYNKVPGTYVPNWDPSISTGSPAVRGTSLTLTPVVLVSQDPNPTLSSPQWTCTLFKDGLPAATYNLSTNPITGITVANNGTVTVSKNILENYDVVRFEVSGNYVESPTVSTPLKANISFGKVINEGKLAFAIIDSPTDTFKYTKDGASPSSVVLTALLFRGKYNDYDTTPVDNPTTTEVDESGTDGKYSVKWQVYDTNNWVDIVSGATAQVDGVNKKKWEFTNNRLTVYPEGVDNIATFRAVVTDQEDNNTVYYAYQTLYDSSDPIQLVVESSAGNLCKGGVIASTLTATLQRNNANINIVSNNNTEGFKATYTWGRIPARIGEEQTDWKKTGASVAITGADIVKGGSTVFQCTAVVTYNQAS